MPNALRLLLAAAVCLVATGCGGSDGSERGSNPRTEPSATSPAPPDGSAALTVENVAEQCDLLLGVAVTMHGLEPEETVPLPVEDVTADGFTYQSAGCAFVYEERRVGAEHRLEIRLDAVPDDASAMAAYWAALERTETIEGLGEAASWHLDDEIGVTSTARALVEGTVVSVELSAPESLAGEVFLTKDFAVAALEMVLDHR